MFTTRKLKIKATILGWLHIITHDYCHNQLRYLWSKNTKHFLFPASKRWRLAAFPCFKWMYLNLFRLCVRRNKTILGSGKLWWEFVIIYRHFLDQIINNSPKITINNVFICSPITEFWDQTNWWNASTRGERGYRVKGNILSLSLHCWFSMMTLNVLVPLPSF